MQKSGETKGIGGYSSYRFSAHGYGVFFSPYSKPTNNQFPQHVRTRYRARLWNWLRLMRM